MPLRDSLDAFAARPRVDSARTRSTARRYALVARRPASGGSVRISAPVSRHHHRVLEVRRQAPVLRHRRPAVRQHLHRRLARVHHRLDREDHALRQPRPASRRCRSSESAAPRGARCRCRGRRTRAPPKTRCASTCCLHRRADVRHPRARLDRARSRDRATSSVTCSSRSASGETLPDRHRHRRVAEEPVQLRAHVDRQDVALDQRPRRRDPVHHLLVHRRANRRRVAVIPLERRLGARLAQPLFGELRRDPPSSRRAPPARNSASTRATSCVDARQLLDFRRRPADNHARAPAAPSAPRAAGRTAASAEITSADDRRTSTSRTCPATARRRSARNVGRALVEVDHRPRLAPVDLQPLAHHRSSVVRARSPARRRTFWHTSVSASA